MGPAFAAPVAPKAAADRAITEAIAVIEIIFMSRPPLTGMSTLDMGIGGNEIDYIKSHHGYLDWTNDDAPAHFISFLSSGRDRRPERMNPCLMEAIIGPSIYGQSA
jgi:hypothetical protein